VNWTLHLGSALDVLRALPEASVHAIVTSPPYFGLRDYGTARWEGGDPACEHALKTKPRNDTTGSGVDKGRFAGTRGEQPSKTASLDPRQDKSRCPACGAVRVDQQIGLDPDAGRVRRRAGRGVPGGPARAA
jgi:site-specific DNA-methyltransferase (cytosine-N4-specific)